MRPRVIAGSLATTVAWALTLAAAALCGAAVAGESVPRSYLDLPLDAAGMPRSIPYVWERRHRGKQAVVIGTRHIRDADSPMYASIERIFERVRPQIVLHESTAPEALKSMSRADAIHVGADLGFAVHLAGSHGIATRSADASAREEIRELLVHYDAREILVFLTMQRLVGSVRNQDLDAAAAGYHDFFEDYLVGNGMPRRAGWESWQGFLREYRRVVGRDLTKDAWNPYLISPIRNAGRLSELARATNAVRDRYLLSAIRSALQEHDRVVVVFGNWHVLAVEPVLGGVFLPGEGAASVGAAR